MIRTALAASACGLALVLPTALVAPASAAPSLTGTWKGQVIGDAGSGGAYPAKVTIAKKKGKLVAKISYPGHCRGVWRQTGKKGGWTTFRETIKTGGCVSPVQVKARRSGAKLKVQWREPISGDQATMTAKKA